MKRHWKWNRKTGKWQPRNTPYEGHYYCSRCGRWIPKAEANQNLNGTPHCPNCHKPLRTRPRMYGKRKPKRSTLAENASSLQSPVTAKPRKTPVVESIIKTAKQEFSESSRQYNEKSTRNMEAWKK